MDEKKKWFFGIATVFSIVKALLATVVATVSCGWIMFSVLANEPGALTPKFVIIVFWIIFVAGVWIITFGWNRLLVRNKSKPQPYTELQTDLDTRRICSRWSVQL